MHGMVARSWSEVDKEARQVNLKRCLCSLVWSL